MICLLFFLLGMGIPATVMGWLSVDALTICVCVILSTVPIYDKLTDIWKMLRDK